MTTPITLKDIIQAVKESKTSIETGNCEAGCCPSREHVIDADLFIQALQKLEKEKEV